jgi:endonuclease G
MRPIIPAEEFLSLVKQTLAERTRVRAAVARGRWLESEPDKDRAKAFLARRQLGSAPRGAEAVQGETIDYQSAAFLVEGAQVRRAVGYVELNAPGQSRMGSGFLVGPGLFLTNCHVLGNEDEALAATVTFDRELDPGLAPTTTSVYRLDPQRLFLCQPVDGLDFALVALGERLSGSATLEELGFCPISPSGDKHAIGMNVNIIQHPRGHYKQVAIRNNLLTHRTPRSLLYETDTEVGSSGSPVFNDSWDVVALHHWGEPYLAKLDLDEASEIPVHVNEGVRVSAIHAALSEQLAGLGGAQHALLAQVLSAHQQVPAGPVAPVLSGPRRRVPQPRSEGALAAALESAVSIPLEISIRLAGSASPAAPAQAQLAPPRRLMRSAEAVRIDTRYHLRRGYIDEGFIPGHTVPLPELDAQLAEQLQPLRAGERNAAQGELKYQHFSVKINRDRRMAIFTATNIDGDTYKTVDRDTGRVVSEAEGETWYKDPRVSESSYLGQDFYSAWSAYFDRGHLTRRTDPTWGTDGKAERANADTFHLTNCSPQHFRFNQSAQYWQGLERYVLENGVLSAGEDARLCVFQGPLFDDSIDLWADDVQIPSSFWKVVVWKGAAGLKAVGLVADQLQLLSEPRSFIGQPKALQKIAVSQWRVPIATIARRAGLKFADTVVAGDTHGGQQPVPGAEAAQRIGDWSDIQL